MLSTRRRASALLARHGVTGITDTSHGYTLDDYACFAEARRQGLLLQDAIIMGDASLDGAVDYAGVHRGATKFHLHDNELPDFDQLCDDIRRSHGASRAVAFHCVTRADLTFALSALTEAGSCASDRIEHAAIAPPDAVAAMRELGITVVTQPHFIAERGDAYRNSVEADDLSWLYRSRGLLDAGVPLAAGSDAPYGSINPWLSMEAAVTRQTVSGYCLGPAETLSPEQALALFTGPLAAPGTRPPRFAAGATASCCLLDRSCASARRQLSAVTVRSTIVGGSPVWPA